MRRVMRFARALSWIGGLSLWFAFPASAATFLTCQLPGFMVIRGESVEMPGDSELNCRDLLQDRDYRVIFSALGSGVYIAARSGVSLLCLGTDDLGGETFYGAHVSANLVLGARAGVFYGPAGSCYLLGLNALAIGADVSGARIEIR